MTSEDSDTDFDGEVDSKVNESTQLFLVNNIKKIPEVLLKSQLPSVKKMCHLNLFVVYTKQILEHPYPSNSC